MNPSIESFQEYIRSNPVNYGCKDFDSLFDLFYWYYTEINPNINEQIRSLYTQLNTVCKALTLSELDELYTLTGLLYAQLEKQAFRSGLRVGMQWMQELQGQDT